MHAIHCLLIMLSILGYLAILTIALVRVADSTHTPEEIAANIAANNAK